MVVKDRGKKIECEHCKYMMNSKETLDVHIGKNHSDNFNCGLCDNTFESKENLEIHLNTCKIFRCTKCNEKKPTLSTMKDHVINQLDSEMYLMIDVYKISRQNNEEITWRDFYFGF